ncbi:CPBP family intramembrane glutamic endopeptidase [Gammaproteobacteria bacterium AB-CW1]|uniref:CPBP family intramembrane glutamic endopeptidase n=1 Tax=Natronospira elongata TaxID=3110268 RepID=A0AAP6MM22_9GAMM|nr:CPBP family intramembrane glutamic endopeptidase [Gammaproteobacteria bacterium AB-CW1]
MDHSRVKDDPLIAGLLFQGGLVILALILAWLLSINLAEHLDFSTQALLLAIPATLVIFLAFGLLIPFRFQWARELEEQVLKLLHGLFRGHSHGWALPLALLAGVGEELLFRGVAQTWLQEHTAPWLAILIPAVVFGLLHFLSTAYFILATLMGIYMGLLYYWSGNLLLPILVHFLYDWVAISYYLRKPPPTDESPDEQEAGGE